MPASAVLFAVGCGYYQAGAVDGEDDPLLPSGDASTPAAGDDVPCDVASVLSTYCLGCHGDPPAGGAPFPLVTREDLLAPSPADPAAIVAERAVARMQDGARPMPPAGLPAPSADEIALVAAWVQAGLPAETCADGSGGGDGGGGGGGGGGGEPQPTTCTSGETWPENWDDLDQYEDGSPDMNPGLACRDCHLDEDDDLAFFFMGTVFPTLHEEDRCYSDVPAGTVVEIIDRNGQVALELEVRERGNFFSSSTSAQVELPFTARVVTPDGATIQMNTPQMTGDCNGCHTEQGENGAPGRILLPAP